MGLTTPGKDGLQVESVALSEVAARFGTPCYVYSRAALGAAYGAYRDTLQAHGLLDRSLVCYAVKANSNLAILNLFARLGAGFDIVSGGELARVLAAGGKAEKIVFSGVGKSRTEMRTALEAGIHCFNVESASELEQLSEVAGSVGRRAPVSLRVNPDVDAKTHPYISTGLKTAKFGVAFGEAFDLYRPRRLPAAYRGEGHRLPHRFAAARPGAGGGSCRQGAGAGRSPCSGRHQAGTHRPRRRHGHPVPR